MGESDARLTVLFDRYYSGVASEAEISELMALVIDLGETDHIMQLLKDRWDNLHQEENQFSRVESNALFSSIVSSESQEVEGGEEAENKGIRFLTWIRYAAAVVILMIGAGLIWKLQNKHSVDKMVAESPTARDIPAGGNKAILTLSDGSRISLDSVGNGLLARQGAAEIRKTQSGQLVYDLGNIREDELALRMNTISTPKGGTYQIALPDGSRVWLNAASSISFPAAFGKNERKVTITGEAYFEVEKDKTRPFRVSFGDIEVQVFGTSFNIMAYSDERSSYTTLVEGSIALKKGEIRKQLRPGEQAAILRDGKMTTEQVDLNEAIAWKNGLFFFKDAGVESVMKQVARWYDVEISYEGKVPVRQLTGKVSRNVNISELIGMLSYTGIKCRLEGRKVIISS